MIAGITRAHPDARIVVLTTYEGDEDIHRALAAGARGYVIKAMPHDVLLTAMRTVHAGGHSIPKPVATALASRVPFAELTSRETQILELITRGMSNREIADSTGITEGTVKGHVRRHPGKARRNTPHSGSGDCHTARNRSSLTHARGYVKFYLVYSPDLRIPLAPMS